MAKKKKSKKFSKVFSRWLYGNRETLSNLKKMPYRKYLKTEHWKSTREKRIRLSKYKCDNCGCKTTRLEVHHKTYVRRGREKMSDLQSLCVACHRKIHNIEYYGSGE